MKKQFLIANIVLLVIFIALLEGVSYFIIKAKLGDFDLNTQGGTTMVKSPYQVWEHPAFYKSWSGKTEFNNLGLRRRDDTNIEKPANTVRIVLFGGSAAFGSQAMPGSLYLQLSGTGEYANEETITANLENLLNAKYPHKTFEVINAATNWSRLHQQMLHYLRQIRSLDPDLVLSMDAYNDSSQIRNINTWKDTAVLSEQDLFGNFKHRISPLFKNSYTAYLLAMIIFRTEDSYQPDQQLIEQYQAITEPRDLDQKLAKARVENKQALEKNVDEYMASMEYFNQVLERDNIPHTFYLQPLTILDDTKQLTSIEQAIQGYQYSTLDESQLLRLNFYDAIAKRGQKLEQIGKLDFESMLDVFAGEKSHVYSDYCHFTPEGNRLLAEYFLQEIETKHAELLR